MAGIVRITLRGHLTRISLQEELSRAENQPRLDDVGLLVDCQAMSDYDADARALFVTWNARMRDRVRGVAIVTDRVLWSVVISAMALASGQRMRAFSTTEAAEQWLTTLSSLMAD